jgi:response regulator RpfG family c-di-GMP phosphodiesterase
MGLRLDAHILPMTMKTARILCVDDEPKVLEGLQRVLHNKYAFLSANSGDEALRVIARSEHIEVIVCDMRMPEMNGTVVLAECRKRSPDTVRVLLTGQADLESAISAVNEGQVFRFLTKPCPPLLFLEAVAAAVEKGRQAVTERELLERSVAGSVRALTEVIELVHPGTLGKTSRQLERARKVAAQLHVGSPWHVEVAAILSQVGYVILPNDLLARNGAEQGMLARVPLVLARVLSGIPRLEDAQRALKYQDRPFESSDHGPQQEDLPIGSRILKALSDLALEETHSLGTSAALTVLRSRPGTYDPSVLEAIAAVCAPSFAGQRSVSQ